MACIQTVFAHTMKRFYPVLKEHFFQTSESGGYSEEVTPVPIPNTAVKLFSADGSWGFPPVRAGRRLAKLK